MPERVRGWHERVDKGIRSVAELVLREGETSGNDRIEVKVNQIIPPDTAAERNSFFGSPRVKLSFYRPTDKALLCQVTLLTGGARLDQPGCDTKAMGLEAITINGINAKEKWVWFYLIE
jgi:hypothetical protein